MKHPKLPFKNMSAIIGLAGLCFSPTASWGTVLFWNLNEVFSSADGSIQFVELVTPAAGPGDTGTLGAYELVNEKGQRFFFQMIYGGGSGSTFLLATPGFSSLSGVPPDVEFLPTGFLAPGSGALHLQPYGYSFDTGLLSWSQLSIDGTSSFGPTGVNPVNSPENHAGQIGFVVVPEPSSILIILWSIGTFAWSRLVKWSKRLPA